MDHHENSFSVTSTVVFLWNTSGISQADHSASSLQVGKRGPQRVQYFHLFFGDKLINPIIGFYIPIIRIPSLKVG